MSAPRLFTQNLSFHINNTNVNFNDVSMSFTYRKYGIVGDNGVGKTTLLKLLSKQLDPEKGDVQSSGSILYLPQSHEDIVSSATLATALGISQHLGALKRLNEGTTTEHDFELLDGFWDIEARIKSVFSQVSLWPINLSTAFHKLSGGQKTKVLLAKALLFQTDFILMDEPTNNLDTFTRKILYDFISQYNKGIIIVSHDRTLLNLMDEVIEITPLNIKHYGGNFDFYQQQKSISREALEKAYNQAQHTIKRTKLIIQASKEKHDRLANRGRKAFQRGQVGKITARSKQGRSEKTHGKLTGLSNKMTQEKQSALSEIASKIEHKIDITGYIEKTAVPNDKVVLSICDLTFQYDKSTPFMINRFNMQLIGPKRIAISGSNGSGKSTLLKLIIGNLKPNSGVITTGVNQVAYLDQSISLLKPNETLIDNFIRLNQGATQFDAHHALAAFMFRNKGVDKQVCHLSGGERIRAGLAITLMSKTPPQLLILDEPTNHLDLRSIQAIEDILLQYQGALLVVSHDANFIRNIKVDQSFHLTRQESE